MGAEADIIAYCRSRYFGLKAFGTTYGYGFGAYILAGAVGPLLMGGSFDLTHSYTVPLGTFCFAMLSAAGLMNQLGPYRYTAQQREEDALLASVQAESRA